MVFVKYSVCQGIPLYLLLSCYDYRLLRSNNSSIRIFRNSFLDSAQELHFRFYLAPKLVMVSSVKNYR